MNKLLGLTLLVALVALGVSIYGVFNRPINITIEREQLGAISGPDVLNPIEFKGGLFVTSSSTLAIGTTSNNTLKTNQGLVIDGQNATPTIAFFATSTISGSGTWSSTSVGSGCIQFNSGTTSGQYFRLFVGERGDGADTPSLGGTGLIFEAGACQ